MSLQTATPSPTLMPAYKLSPSPSPQRLKPPKSPLFNMISSLSSPSDDEKEGEKATTEGEERDKIEGDMEMEIVVADVNDEEDDA
ncbi:hypothetical protein L6452_38502 [Arctium lappa]|uniref:Uncharacterized protein n=1 Tax=Arctium lappa TaxID=4217 RepID=A0ACB8XQB0_ARCLA|nr:hypothetical protein L6452_38502 [Arctium lappa]